MKCYSYLLDDEACCIKSFSRVWSFVDSGGSVLVDIDEYGDGDSGY